MTTWWKGQDFEYLKNEIQKKLMYYQYELDNNIGTKYTKIRYLYLSILLTQLVNSSRVSEATEAFYHFYRQNNYEVKVKVRKKKNDVYRTIYIPKIIIRNYCSHIQNMTKKNGEINPHRVSWWINKYWKVYVRDEPINTHTMRHCGITYLAEKFRANPLEIQTITKQTPTIISNYVHMTHGMKYQKQIIDELNNENKKGDI